MLLSRTCVTSKIAQPWIVSYDAVPQVLELYTGFATLRYNLSYSAQARYAGSEAMFFSKNLVVPTTSDPTRIARAHPAQLMLQYAL